MTRISTCVLAVLCLLLCIAQGTAHAQPKVILVFVNHLSLSDLESGCYYKGLTSGGFLIDRRWINNFAPHTLVSPGLPSKTNPIETNYARMSDSTVRPEFSEGGLAATGLSAITTTIIGTTAGDDSGQDSPITQFVSDPADQINPERHDPLAPGGVADDPKAFRDAAFAALKTSDLVIVQWGDFDRIQNELSQHLILPSVSESDRGQVITNLGRFAAFLAADKRANTPEPLWFVIVSPIPPIDSHGGWNSLTPFVATRLDRYEPSAEYTSDTTHTSNLIAQRDIAPTLLSLLGRPIDAEFTGSRAVPDAQYDPMTSGVQSLDLQTRNNQIVESPFFWTMGFLLGIIGFAVVWTMRAARSRRTLDLCAYGLRIIAVWPGAMLVAAVWPSPNPEIYFACIYALIFLLALLPSVAVILVGTSAILLLDCVTGSHLISQSLFSAYTLSGIRFYGIGNEYMGVLIAGTLLACQSICEKLTSTNGTIRTRSWRLPTWLLFTLVTVVMSCPAFGAKAGAALTCGVTFATAYGLLGTGKVRVWHVLIGLFGGFLMLGFWIAASSALGLRHTHLQAAYSSVGVGKGPELFALVWSKLELALAVITHPGTIVGGGALIIFGFAVQYFLRRPLEGYGTKHPAAKSLYTASLVGCTACLLFNDSGVVAAILLFSMMTVSLLYGLVMERCELQPSILEKSELA